MKIIKVESCKECPFREHNITCNWDTCSKVLHGIIEDINKIDPDCPLDEY